MTASRPWNHLPPDLQQRAREEWGRAQLARVETVPEPCRLVITPGGHHACDPAWVSRWPREAFRMLGFKPQEPDYQCWRTQQVILNRGWMHWHLPRGSWRGRAAHIVGSGPSAQVAARAIPAEDRRAGVIAINASLELLPHADLWVVVDALMPGITPWQPGPWLERPGVRDAVEGVAGVFRCSARHDLVKRVRQANVYLPASMEHRDLIRPEVQARLPCFVEGNQALVPALHLAWWLGADPICLWGVEQGTPSGGDHRYYGAPGSPVPEHRKSGFEAADVGVVGGHVDTTPDHLESATQAAATAMWITDAGTRVWNCSAGVDYIFARWMPPSAVIEATEAA